MASQSDRRRSSQADEEDEQPPPEALARRQNICPTLGFNPSEDTPDDASFPRIVFHKSDDVKKKLEESIKDNFLFKELEPDQLIAIIDAMEEVKVKKGDVVIKQGEDGEFFYVIYSGTYEARVATSEGTEIIMHTYVNNGSFGELALMYNQPRQATVKAVTGGSVYALDRALFKRIVVKSTYVKRKLYCELINKVSLFRALTDVEKHKISDVLSTMVFSDGEMIINQGETADGMYFVISGSVEITKTVGNKVVPVKVVHSGDYFGELGLLRNKPRAANGRAVGRTKVAFLAAEAFDRLTASCLETMQISAEDYV